MKKNFNFIFIFLFLIISCKSNQIDIFSLKPSENNKNLDFRPNKWTNSEGFSIAIIPDTQSYVDVKSQTFYKKPYPINQWEIYYRQTKFIADHSIQNGGDFAFALHVGDHVEKCSKQEFEWIADNKALNNLNNNIPFLTVPGNHDYDKWILNKQVEGSKKYNKYLGPDSSFFKDKYWYKGSSKEGRNSYAIFNAANQKILVIGLELNPDEDSIKWAQDILNQYNTLPTIILIHQYLSSVQKNKFSKKTNEINPNHIHNINYNFSKTNYRTLHKGWLPEQIWKDFISQNNQIFLVISGHVGTPNKGCGYRIDKNKAGFTTYSFFSNFQFYNKYLSNLNLEYNKKPRDCGDGWMSVIDIDLTNKKIDFSCFNSDTGLFINQEPYMMTFPIDWNWEERFLNNKR